MKVRRRYFKAEDPLTGVETKFLGWSAILKIPEFKVSIREDDFVVEKFNVVETERHHVPRGKSVVEISEEEYERMHPKGESLTSQLRRESQILRMRSFLAKPEKPQIDTAEVLVEHLEKLI